MAVDQSRIEWTDATWSPVRGCSIVSKGCTNCYAMRQGHRFNYAGGPYEGLTKLTKGGPVWSGEIRLVPELLDAPLHWKRPRRIFVNSMSDLFHERVSDEYITSVWRTMADAQQHIFQILTKRPQRMLDYLLPSLSIGGIIAAPLPNVWLGVSVEDQATADERIPLLLQAPAAVRFISAEPLLGAISLGAVGNGPWWNTLTGCGDRAGPQGLEHMEQVKPLNWIIVGGESGHGARPMHPDWARSLRDQCAAARVPFFFKQWGNWMPTRSIIPGARSGAIDIEGKVPPLSELDKMVAGKGRVLMARVDKKTAGRELDGRTHDEYPA
jgi:protein gp37